MQANGERVIGRRIVEAGRVGSTMDVAAGLAFAGSEEGTAVVAEEQTCGRGRRGSGWISPPGVNLYVSVVLRPEIQADQTNGLAFVGALGAATFLRSTFGLAARLKWPNDVLVGHKKIAGVIVEALLKPGNASGHIEAAILGIGLNVNWLEIPAEIEAEATSIACELGAKVDLRACLEGLLFALDEEYSAYRERGFASVLARWREMDCTIGSRIVLLNEDGSTLEGAAVDITPYGALIVETASGERRIAHAGQVRISEFGG